MRDHSAEYINYQFDQRREFEERMQRERESFIKMALDKAAKLSNNGDLVESIHFTT